MNTHAFAAIAYRSIVLTDVAGEYKLTVTHKKDKTNMDTTAAEVAAFVSDKFRSAFESHPLRDVDPAMALDSAREDASRLVPPAFHGQFDDETLTFEVQS